MTESDERPCPACGHANKLSWVLCDGCGARLPWAPPPRAGIATKDMTEEQLAARYLPPIPKQPPFLLTPQGKKSLGVIIFLLSLLWTYLAHFRK